MVAIYLWFNAVLYAAFAIWCLVSVEKTAATIGYVALNGSGRVEYMTVYSGLQFGLALFFALAAYKPVWQPAGLMLAVVMYTPLVLVRWFGIVQTPGLSKMTIPFALLETLTWLAALVLFWRTPSGV